MGIIELHSLILKLCSGPWDLQELLILPATHLLIGGCDRALFLIMRALPAFYHFPALPPAPRPPGIAVNCFHFPRTVFQTTWTSKPMASP